MHKNMYDVSAGMLLAGVMLVYLASCHSPKGGIQTAPLPTEPQTYLPDTAGKPAKVVFDSSLYHFGELTQGDTLQRVIFFTNAGPGDLVIELVTACECTSLEWPRRPVRPGSRGRIFIVYNSRDKQGPQTVDVDIIANTEPIVSSTKFKLWVRPKN